MKYAAHTLMTVAALSLSAFSFAMKAPTETAPTAASSGEAPATQTCPSKEVTQAYLVNPDKPLFFERNPLNPKLSAAGQPS